MGISKKFGNTAKEPSEWPLIARNLPNALECNATLFTTPFATSNINFGMSHLANLYQDWILSQESWDVQSSRQRSLMAISSHEIGYSDHSFFNMEYRRWQVPIIDPQMPINVTMFSVPILLVNALWDPLTSYDIAISMQQKIKGSTLLNGGGDGHCTYPLRNGETTETVN